ncbi:nuclear transport factor 2 family protein [Flavobacterium sp. ALJ2]|uniref:nuclear transport factor 2 family protein n=1 Tax=Flavobacterium sp. ALJ2 TaxID=2786960 RepID=UPI001E4B0AFD|nr:nuclear transport factor 2 family protein [Flavobacterium sp. ALJ2]
MYLNTLQKIWLFSRRPINVKGVKLLDVSTRTASVKLIADTWIDYMDVVKTNDEWKIINVL